MITAGGTEGMFDVLLATTDPGDEVILTDPDLRRDDQPGAPRPARCPGSCRSCGTGGSWRLDLDALRPAVWPRTRVVFLMNPSMPSGAVLDAEEWEAVAALCAERDCWLLYNAAMERILFDGRRRVHPAVAARHGASGPSRSARCRRSTG